jgi:hypothetical protein
MRMKKNVSSKAPPNKAFTHPVNNLIYPFSQKVLAEDDLNRVKGTLSHNQERLVIEYLGDVYLYKKKCLGQKVYYEFSSSISYD